MANQTGPPRWNWWSIAAAWLVLLAIVYHHLAQAAYPTFFMMSPAAVRESWAMGWPLTVATCSTTGQWSGFSPLSLIFDLAFAAVLVGGTLAAISSWTRGQIASLPVNRKSLAVVVLAGVGWLLLAQTLTVPLNVFLGWASLVVIFLAVPCAAHSAIALALKLRRSPRFSIRTLLVAITVVCIGAAVVAWRMNAIRAARLAQVPRVRVESMDYGLMERVETRENGRFVSRDYRIIKRTQAIPCSLGTIFGIEYVLSNDQPSANKDAPRQDPVKAYFVWHYPADITDPKKGTTQRQSELQYPVRTGERHVEVFWLGSEPYLVPGQWKLEMWQSTGIPGDRRKLLEQVFVVGEK